MPLATTFTTRDGNGAAAPFGSMQDLAGNNGATVSLDNGRQVYRASANFTPQATAAVTLVSVQGSASRTIRIHRVCIGGVSTALSASVFQLLRTSALGAGGTTVNPTIAKNDVNSATATAVVAHYTATLKATGVAVGGPLMSGLITTSTVTTPTVSGGGQPQYMFPEAGAPIGQAIVLRGTADFLEIQNVTPANLGAGSVLAYSIEWSEDSS